MKKKVAVNKLWFFLILTATLLFLTNGLVAGASAS
jgi:hypothetical protein